MESHSTIFQVQKCFSKHFKAQLNDLMSAKNELLVVRFPRGRAPLLTELCHCRWGTNMRGAKASSWSWACPFYSAKWILPGSSCMLNCIKYIEAWMQEKILYCIWTAYFTSFRNWRGEKRKKKKKVNLEVKLRWNFTLIFMKQKLDAGKELNFRFVTQLQKSIFLSTSELARAFICATCFCCMLNS